ncbi:dCTP deaminase domain-containing protein [Shewanella frigidimarina]|jgi:deoxycytidine triphosphate deaminase|uniref:DeoxyUTP pyrophosphatase n=1 Tax=Shewanella frigidimarina (strain NCIMB 400) TaxID=318167 RepID=Q07XN6_SHEFN|nr:dUTP pyrophosphatase [Shewanella frigidimarina]ABI73228.1 deoxyUTP pyrophosphatase [Shewanella frigidimarina NCIMB 400]
MTVLQVKGRTTNSEAYFDAHSLSNSSFIYTNASEDNIEEYSLELTLGSGWNNSYSLKNQGLIEISECISIPKHGSIVVEVNEDIYVPHNKYGIVVPTGSMFLSQGVLIASAKVEPAFIGKLKLRMYNTTAQKVNINKGDKIGSVIFFSTESTKVHDKTYKSSSISISPESTFNKALKWCNYNRLTLIGWIVTSIIGPMLLLGSTYILYYKDILENNNKNIDSKINSEIELRLKKLNKEILPIVPRT